MSDPSQARDTQSDLEASRMPLLDHLVELRSRLIKSVFYLALAFALCLFFIKPIMSALVLPFKQSGLSELNNTKTLDGFFTYIKIALFAGLMLAFPFISNQLWRFIAPGLYKHEKAAFRPFLILTPLLFLSGAALAYFAVLPIALKYLWSYQGDFGGVTIKPLPSLGDYISFSTSLLFGFGLAFQLPVVLMIAERAGLVSLETLRKGRRYAAVGSTALAAVLTPPDVISMLLLMLPLIILYELALIAIGITRTRRTREGAHNVAIKR
jgi:sec-independent protein translocase protein TatC